MIGKIKGTLSEIDGTIGLIETSYGVFYNVFFTTSLLANYQVGSPVEIYTYHHVREDAQILFGFENKKDYKLFTMLLTVSGVGPKTAYGVISATNADSLIDAIKHNNPAYFTKIPGLGKKTALKIILELSAKFEGEYVFTQTYVSPEDKTAVDALVALGYPTQDAKDVIHALDKGLTTEEKITAGIRQLSKK